MPLRTYKPIPMALVVSMTVLSLIGLSCRNPRDLPVYYLDQEMLDYCWFTEGSYWVYENDSFPGLEDSVVITGTSVYIKEPERSGTTRYEAEHRVQRYEYFGNQYRSFIYPSVLSSGDVYYHLYSEIDENINNSGSYPLFTDPKGSDSLLLKDNRTFIKERLDSLEVKGQVFSDVIIVAHKSNYANNPCKEITWAKHVGVIRRVFWDGSSWSLKRYEVY